MEYGPDRNEVALGLAIDVLIASCN